MIVVISVAHDDPCMTIEAYAYLSVSLHSSSRTDCAHVPAVNSHAGFHYG